MKRSSFLKSLLGIAVAPTVLSAIDTKTPDVPVVNVDEFKIHGISHFRCGDIIRDSQGHSFLVTLVAKDYTECRRIDKRQDVTVISSKKDFDKYHKVYTTFGEHNQSRK